MSVRVWSGLVPVVVRFCREYRVGFNEVVNRALEAFLCGVDAAELKLLARRAVLVREESELRRVCNTMLRSGSYLPNYVQRVLREPGRPLGHLMEAQKPLKALDPLEEKAFRQIVKRREMIARELAEIELELLKDVRPFRLKPDSWRSKSLASDKTKRRVGENRAKIVDKDSAKRAVNKKTQADWREGVIVANSMAGSWSFASKI